MAVKTVLKASDTGEKSDHAVAQKALLVPHARYWHTWAAVMLPHARNRERLPGLAAGVSLLRCGRNRPGHTRVRLSVEAQELPVGRGMCRIQLVLRVEM